MATEIYDFYVDYLKNGYKFALAAYRSGLTQMIFDSRGYNRVFGVGKEEVHSLYTNMLKHNHVPALALQYSGMDTVAETC